MKHKQIIKKMTLVDKVALCSGANFWRTKLMEKYDIPSIMLCDGPHGLRKQEVDGDIFNINESKQATCFPAACATGSSWDRDLVKEIGRAIAKEALQEEISVLLGPGINIKRNPLCGRNFEYFSEDPYVTGELATAFIQGVEELGVGTSLKHFAANSQENNRYSSNSIIDERTLREIYLYGFEKAVKNGKPSTVMCAYNKLNGTYCSDNNYLLRKILRDDWGYEGVIITDWGAMNNRIKAFEAGTDLEMPGGSSYFDNEIIKAVKCGKLSEKLVDETVERLLALIFRSYYNRNRKYSYNKQEHHLLARKAATNSAILLKNDEKILPLHKSQKIALIGNFAKTIRYQGSGSSHINPTKLTNVYEVFQGEGIDYTYYEGYKENGETDDILLREAMEGAMQCDKVIVFAGLTKQLESEGFDRETLSMPNGHNRLIQEVSKTNSNIVVVLMGGAVITMPWLEEVKAVLHMYLPGQAGGEAIVDLLYGAVNPSGKLSETYPLSYIDVPSAGFYEKGGKQAQYREGIYVGYRYYDRAGINVSFPFGFGLSYTTFEYSDIKIDMDKEEIKVSILLKNIGEVAGAEVVQLYISDLQKGVHRPEKELKGFSKIYLEAGEYKRITFYLEKRSFAFYDVESKDWQIQKGDYDILIAASSRDIRLRKRITLEGTITPAEQVHLKGTWYEHLCGKPEKEEFDKLLGWKINEQKSITRKNYTTEHSIMDMQGSYFFRIIYLLIRKYIKKKSGIIDNSDPTLKMILSSSTEVPIKNLSMLSGGKLQRNIAEGLIQIANGRYIEGIKNLLKRKN
jgi:beta-glucosidase